MLRLASCMTAWIVSLLIILWELSPAYAEALAGGNGENVFLSKLSIINYAMATESTTSGSSSASSSGGSSGDINENNWLPDSFMDLKGLSNDGYSKNDADKWLPVLSSALMVVAAIAGPLLFFSCPERGVTRPYSPVIFMLAGVGYLINEIVAISKFRSLLIENIRNIQLNKQFDAQIGGLQNIKSNLEDYKKVVKDKRTGLYVIMAAFIAAALASIGELAVVYSNPVTGTAVNIEAVEDTAEAAKPSVTISAVNPVTIAAVADSDPPSGVCTAKIKPNESFTTHLLLFLAMVGVAAGIAVVGGAIGAGVGVGISGSSTDKTVDLTNNTSTTTTSSSSENLTSKITNASKGDVDSWKYYLKALLPAGWSLIILVAAVAVRYFKKFTLPIWSRPIFFGVCTGLAGAMIGFLNDKLDTLDDRISTVEEMINQLNSFKGLASAAPPKVSASSLTSSYMYKQAATQKIERDAIKYAQNICKSSDSQNMKCACGNSDASCGSTVKAPQRYGGINLGSGGISGITSATRNFISNLGNGNQAAAFADPASHVRNAIKMMKLKKKAEKDLNDLLAKNGKAPINFAKEEKKMLGDMLSGAKNALKGAGVTDAQINKLSNDLIGGLADESKSGEKKESHAGKEGVTSASARTTGITGNGEDKKNDDAFNFSGNEDKELKIAEDKENLKGVTNDDAINNEKSARIEGLPDLKDLHKSSEDLFKVIHGCYVRIVFPRFIEIGK